MGSRGSPKLSTRNGPRHPGASRDGRGLGRQRSVRAILYRECYRGVLVWNKTQKRDRWGQKRRRDRPSTEWLRTPAEDLRIVSDELWAAAHRQLTDRRENYRIWTSTDARGTPE